MYSWGDPVPRYYRYTARHPVVNSRFGDVAWLYPAVAHMPGRHVPRTWYTVNSSATFCVRLFVFESWLGKQASHTGRSWPMSTMCSTSRTNADELLYVRRWFSEITPVPNLPRTHVSSVCATTKQRLLISPSTGSACFHNALVAVTASHHCRCLSACPTNYHYDLIIRTVFIPMFNPNNLYSSAQSR